MIRAVALVAVVVAAIAAAPAAAAPFGPEEERAYAIAVGYWQTEPAPTCSTIDLQVVDEPTLLASITPPLTPGVRYGGSATIPPAGYTGPCFLYVRAGMTWAELCPVMIHEDGHLHGHEHSTDPNDPMYPVAPTIDHFPACVAAAPAPPAAAPVVTAATSPRQRHHHHRRRFARGATLRA